MNRKQDDHEKMLDALLPQTATGVDCRVLPAAQGTQWLREGLALFRRYPAPWLLALAVLFGVMMLLSLLPQVGDLLGFLLGPVLNAGLMYFASRLAAGRNEARIGDLFIGLRQRTAALVGAGALNLLATVLLLGLLLALAAGTLGEEAVQALAKAVQQQDQAAMQAIVTPHAQALLLDLLVVLALYLPVMGALWFAPPLVLLHGCGLGQALRLSLKACLKNALPLLLYGLVVMGWVALLAFAVTALAGLAGWLGSALLGVLLPVGGAVLVASQWASFAQVFPPPAAAGSNDQVEVLL